MRASSYFSIHLRPGRPRSGRLASWSDCDRCCRDSLRLRNARAMRSLEPAPNPRRSAKWWQAGPLASPGLTRLPLLHFSGSFPLPPAGWGRWPRPQAEVGGGADVRGFGRAARKDASGQLRHITHEVGDAQASHGRQDHPTESAAGCAPIALVDSSRQLGE